MTVPAVPETLGERTEGYRLEETELADLWHALIVELLNAEFVGRTHHNRRTYDAGCDGPLCAKAVREHSRRRNNTQPSRRYRYVDALLEYWYPIAERRIEAAHAAVLRELTA